MDKMEIEKKLNEHGWSKTGDYYIFHSDPAYPNKEEESRNGYTLKIGLSDFCMSIYCNNNTVLVRYEILKERFQINETINSAFDIDIYTSTSFHEFMNDLTHIVYGREEPAHNEIPKRYQTHSGKNFMEILKNEMLTHDEYIGFLKGNVYKYVFRYQKKNGKEDLEKAQTYLKLLEDEANG